MLVAEPLLTQLTPLLIKTAAGLALTGLLGVFMWPFRKARKEWVALKNEQSLIHQELVAQRTNCLATLQTQGDKQIELLSKMSGTLENISLSQAEMVGCLRGPVVIRRKIAKK
jgi:hypothetical protein